MSTTVTKPIKKAAPKSKAPAAEHASYQDMIKDAITTLKDRQGSSRMALKKYVKANNKNLPDDKMFDSLFNRALKAGVGKGVFEQPKGPSGGTKLGKKPAAEKKPAAKKPAAPKKTAATKSKKPAAAKPKKETKPKAAAKPKVVKPKAAAKPKAAPAIVEKPAILGKTKSGRVTKTKAAPEKKKAATPKKTAIKKGTPKKAAAPAAA